MAFVLARDSISCGRRYSCSFSAPRPALVFVQEPASPDFGIFEGRYSDRRPTSSQVGRGVVVVVVAVLANRRQSDIEWTEIAQGVQTISDICDPLSGGSGFERRRIECQGEVGC